jgi:hypothetical protein
MMKNMVFKSNLFLAAVFALFVLHPTALEDYDRNYDNSACKSFPFSPPSPLRLKE